MSDANETVKPFSLEDLLKPDVDGRNFETVEVHKGKVLIGSLGSEDMLQWLEDNDVPEKRKEAGLRLIVKSLVNTETKEPIPEADRDAYLAAFRKKDARENGKLVRAILKLNGMGTKAQVEDGKNESGVAPGAASPTV